MTALGKDPRDILIAPVVSEKSYGLLDEGKYTFLVDPRANKTEIKIAVEKVFGVKVTSVNTINRKGKTAHDAFRLRQAQGHQARDRHRCRRRAPSTSSAGRSADAVREQIEDNPMGIRKYKPTTPGRRGSSVADFVEITRSTPEKSLVRPLHQEGRTQQHRPHHHPSPGWRPQARLPRDRLPSSRQGRRAGEGRAHRVRPQPHGAHRAAALRGRREALHHRAEQAVAGRRRSRPVPGADIKPGNNLPLRNIPIGTVIHAIELQPGGGAQDRPLGRCLGAARRQGRPVRAAAHAVRRDPQRRRALPRDRRRGRQRRAVEHQLGQGRPHALEGQAPDRPWCRHEPGRPPARWW